MSSRPEADAAPRKKPQHSSTFYLPRATAEFIVRGIRVCAAKKYGMSGSLGKGSPWILDMLNQGFFEEGLVDEFGKWKVDRLVEAEKALAEQAKLPKIVAKKKSG